VPADRSEADLIEGAKRGDRDAMEALVLLHQDRVFAVLSRSVPREEVEDMAQEAFLRAFRGIDRFRGDARFGTWLFQVVRHLLIDRQRARKRRGDHVALQEETGEPKDAVLRDPRPRPDAARERRIEGRQVRAALDRLGERDRIAMILHDQEGMSGPEVASIIGGSPGALRIRLMRARGKLRMWLREGEAGT
jgi:RNA polymerase sigma-70 factor, ECF subfamily